MLLECAVLQECRDEYYTAGSLNNLFETIPETCVGNFCQQPDSSTWYEWSDILYNSLLESYLN